MYPIGGNFAQEIRDLLDSLLPPNKMYHPMVGKDVQDEKLALLDKAIPHESFYFVFNLLTGEFDHVNGVEKWLGYSKQAFNLNSYLNAVHPGQATLHQMLALSIYKILCTGETFKLQFSTQRYISQIGLKHYNGDYITFKKTTSIFQYDNENRLLAQLNEFTKIDSHENGPLKPRVFEINGLQKEDFERMVFGDTLKVFMDKKHFSATEFQVLKLYADNAMIGTRQLAGALEVEPSTIDTFNKRILAKARQTFTRTFDNAREVALYLQKEKIL